MKESMAEIATPARKRNPVVWDGKDFSAIQMAMAWVPRRHGQPAATVDGGWHLFIYGKPVEVGSTVTANESGAVTITPPAS
jgi:hypothetical protein